MPGRSCSGTLKRNKPSDLCDKQVRILLREHGSSGKVCIADLVEIACREMPGYSWDHHAILNSIERLEKRGEVTSHHEIRDGRAIRIPCLI